MISKHTSTPWKACERGDYSDFGGNSQVILGQEDDLPFRIAVVHSRDDEGVANAQLIAAAPELLAALKAMMSELEISVGIGRPISDAYIQAAFAIKKAEGK